MTKRIEQFFGRSCRVGVLGVAICGMVAAVSTIYIASPRLAYADDPMPSADDVLNKFIEATGGKEAYAKVTSRVVNGAMEIAAQNIKGTITAYTKAPNMMFVSVDIPGVGVIERGYNGDANVGWEKSAIQGTRLLKGDELDRVKQEAMTQSDLEWKKLYKDAKVVGSEKLGDDDCYKVEMTTNAGKLETRYYDKKTGLLNQTTMDMETPQGVVKVTAKVSDYRDIDGVKVPYKNTQEIAVGGMQMTQEVTLNNIQTNVDAPAGKFDVPDDVKTLAEKEKATSTTAPATK